MITYLDLETTIMKLQMNCRSMDQTLEAMDNELTEVDIGSSWREVEKSYRGYQNTLGFLRGEIKGLFQEVHTMVKADEKAEQEEEEGDEHEME